MGFKPQTLDPKHEPIHTQVRGSKDRTVKGVDGRGTHERDVFKEACTRR